MLKIYLIALIGLYGCNIIFPAKKDLYKIVSKDSKFSKELFLKCEQIYPTDSGFVTLYNPRLDPEKYDPLLLFWNGNFNLIGAMYFSSERIDSIRNSVIYCTENEERKDRYANYNNNIPSNYRIEYKRSVKNVSMLEQSNKLVTDYKFISNIKDSILLSILVDEKNLFSFIDYKSIGVLDSSKNSFNARVLKVVVSDFTFKINDGIKMKINNNNGENRNDVLQFSSVKLEVQFFETIFNKLIDYK